MWIVQLSHDNGGDLAAVIALGTVLRAPVAEKKRFVRIRARTLTLNLTDTARPQPHLDKARKVEVRPPVILLRARNTSLVGQLLSKASSKSGPTSYETWLMAGPIAATIRFRRAPMPSMLATAASMTPLTAPRHPACAAPTTPASGSARSTGAQSAVRMPMTRPGVRVTTASALGRALASTGPSMTTASPLCTW